MTAPSYGLFVGIDVAARSATAVWQRATGAPARPLTFAQDAAGMARLRTALHQTAVAPAHTLIVLEATGSSWITLATTLHYHGYRVSVVNPAQAHHFAKALRKRATTAALDAAPLAQRAARLQPEPWTPPPHIYHELQQRLNQRDTLLTLRQPIRNQRHALSQQPVQVAAVLTRIDELAATLSAQIRAVEAEIAPILESDAAWASAAARLQTIGGIGLLTACWLLTTTLNFTSSGTVEQLTAYAGLAPMVRESGTSVRSRPRIGHAGNRQLRTALYLATLSATRYNPIIRAFYRRVRDAGKPSKVARCAAARKLLHSAWAVVTKDCDFDPTRGTPPADTSGGPAGGVPRIDTAIGT